MDTIPVERVSLGYAAALERIAEGRIVERWEVADTAAIAAQLTGESAA